MSMDESGHIIRNMFSKWIFDADKYMRLEYDDEGIMKYSDNFDFSQGYDAGLSPVDLVEMIVDSKNF